MKQHIMLPRSTLKLFVTDSRLHYLDVESNEIRIGTAKSYNTEENYYPNTTEKFLADEIETIIGQLRRVLVDFESAKCQIALSAPLAQLIAKIFVVQSLRVPDFAEDAFANSIFAEPLGLSVQYYSALHHNVQNRDYLLSQVYDDITNGLLKEYSANILEVPKANRNRSLLLPSSHFIILSNWFILVLNPFWGIVLLPTFENNSMKQGENQQYITAPHDKDVDLINEGALKHERSFRETPKLIGLRPELERMQQYLKTEKQIT